MTILAQFIDSRSVYLNKVYKINDNYSICIYLLCIIMDHWSKASVWPFGVYLAVIDVTLIC